jgi:hypothetical protein
MRVFGGVRSGGVTAGQRDDVGGAFPKKVRFLTSVQTRSTPPLVGIALFATLTRSTRWMTIALGVCVGLLATTFDTVKPERRRPIGVLT